MNNLSRLAMVLLLSPFMPSPAPTLPAISRECKQAMSANRYLRSIRVHRQASGPYADTHPGSEDNHQLRCTLRAGREWSQPRGHVEGSFHAWLGGP